MSIRLWPRSLIGQLVLAVAAMLFVAQGINFAMLARGQKQQTLAHGGGMAVARIIDAIDRDRRGRIDNGAANGRHDRVQKLLITDRPPPLIPGSVSLADLSAYVADLLSEGGVKASEVSARAMPLRPRAQKASYPGRVVVVSARVDGRYFTVRSRIPATGGRLQGFCCGRRCRSICCCLCRSS